jgi:protein-tyrosine phosphatase
MSIETDKFTLYRNKKPKSCSNGYHDRIGNCKNPGHGYHGYYESTKLLDDLISRDTINYKSQDFNVTNELYEKTGAPRLMDIWEPKYAKNTQDHKENGSETVVRNYVNKPDKREHCLHLNNISENLYLSNFFYINDTDKEYDIIINLCSMRLSSKKKAKVYYIDMLDSSHIRYDSFLKIVNEVSDIIRAAELDDKTVLVHCHKGTNRSSACVMAYAILHRDYKLSEIVKYFQNKKAKKFEYWDTLTNMHFYHFLELLENQKRS